MTGIDIAGNALNLIGTILNFITDSRLHNKKKDYMKLIERLREEEIKRPHERIDGEVDNIYRELSDFLRLFNEDLKSSEVPK